METCLSLSLRREKDWDGNTFVVSDSLLSNVASWICMACELRPEVTRAPHVLRETSRAVHVAGLRGRKTRLSNVASWMSQRQVEEPRAPASRPDDTYCLPERLVARAQEASPSRHFSAAGDPKAEFRGPFWEGTTHLVSLKTTAKECGRWKDRIWVSTLRPPCKCSPTSNCSQSQCVLVLKSHIANVATFERMRIPLFHMTLQW